MERFFPLYIAAQRGHTEVVEILIKNGANVNENDNGWTPLQTASLKGREKVVEVLLKNGANINEKNASGKMPDYQIDWQIID